MVKINTHNNFHTSTFSNLKVGVWNSSSHSRVTLVYWSDPVTGYRSSFPNLIGFTL